MNRERGEGMEDVCDLCGAPTGQHRSFFRVVRYRNDQRDQTKEVGVFCTVCSRQVEDAFDGVLKRLEEERRDR